MDRALFHDAAGGAQAQCSFMSGHHSQTTACIEKGTCHTCEIELFLAPFLPYSSSMRFFDSFQSSKPS